MITVSACLIVKNEESILRRCLDSIKDLVEEIIIVDTGSSDHTKEIASEYTDKVFDFEWINDFSAARNFAFSKATCEYIYSADADEILDEANREKFLKLKQVCLPEVEIVQFIYDNPTEINMAYNYLQELRPKLFKRLRTFTWIDPIHETVRTAPVVFDSDIVILHRPLANHSPRDFAAFKRVIAEGRMSDRLFSMYAKELFFSGTKEDFIEACPYFQERVKDICEASTLEALCVVVRSYLYVPELADDIVDFAGEYEEFIYKAAEIDYSLGLFFKERGDEDLADSYMAASREHESYVCNLYKA